MNFFRRTGSGKKVRVKETWVVMKDGDPQFSHIYMGGALGAVNARLGRWLEWDPVAKDGDRVIHIESEDPADGAYWEILRTPLAPDYRAGVNA